MKTRSITSDERILQLLRQKQERLNISYIKTDSGVYKLLSAITYTLGIIATLINLFVIMGIYGRNNATTGYDFENGIKDHIREQLLASNEWIFYLSAVSVLFFAGLILKLYKKNIYLTLISLATLTISGVALILMFYFDLEKTIAEVGASSFVWKHLLPVGGTLLFAISSGIIAIRQYALDKAGKNQISAYIYNKYSAMASDLSEEDWHNVIRDFEITKGKKSKKSHKDLNKDITNTGNSNVSNSNVSNISDDTQINSNETLNSKEKKESTEV